jgi:hypothetical protein
MKKEIYFIFIGIFFTFVLAGAGCTVKSPAKTLSAPTPGVETSESSSYKLPVSEPIPPATSDSPRVIPPTTAQIEAAKVKIQGNNAGTLKVKSTTTTPVKSPLKYAEALAVYQKSGYLIQFDSCHGRPGRLTLKKGVKFMMDNRDSKAHTLAVGTDPHFVNAYGFVIVAAPSPAGRYDITCDGGGAAVLYSSN